MRIAAIASDTQVLANPSASPLDRAEALKFLVHFMGTSTSRSTWPTTATAVETGERSDLLGDSMNLHKAWDGEILEVYKLSDSGYLKELQREMDTLDLAALERGTVVDWAMEGHRIAVQRAYHLPRDGRLGEAYVQASRPVVDHALIAAGVRLAKLLNATLANYQPTPRPHPSARAYTPTGRRRPTSARRPPWSAPSPPSSDHPAGTCT